MLTMSYLGSGEVPHRISETQTDRRFSLVNGVIIDDIVTNHPTGQIRIVSYEKPSPLAADIRTRLSAAGLILGKLHNSQGRRDSYVIPVSSRPLAYEASTSEEDAFTYGDAHLFLDLGELLAEASKAVGAPAVVEGSLESQIAIVEFTEPGSRSLFFTPGIEQSIVEVENPSGEIRYYIDYLNRKMPDNFNRYLFPFMTGYLKGASVGRA